MVLSLRLWRIHSVKDIYIPPDTSDPYHHVNLNELDNTPKDAHIQIDFRFRKFL